MQPDPVEKGVNIPDALIRLIVDHLVLNETQKIQLVQLIQERDELGRLRRSPPLGGNMVNL